jgi:hypothetical protein
MARFLDVAGSRRLPVVMRPRIGGSIKWMVSKNVPGGLVIAGILFQRLPCFQSEIAAKLVPVWISFDQMLDLVA